MLGGDLAGFVEEADEGSRFKKGDAVAALTPGFFVFTQDGEACTRNTTAAVVGVLGSIEPWGSHSAPGVCMLRSHRAAQYCPSLLKPTTGTAAVPAMWAAYGAHMGHLWSRFMHEAAPSQILYQVGQPDWHHDHHCIRRTACSMRSIAALTLLYQPSKAAYSIPGGLAACPMFPVGRHVLPVCCC